LRSLRCVASRRLTLVPAQSDDGLRHIPRRRRTERQALAAIGQGRLIALWDNLFSQLEQPIAQVLLTRMDISDVSSASKQCHRILGKLTTDLTENEVPQRSKYVLGIIGDGRYTHRQRERYRGCLRASPFLILHVLDALRMLT
jgi:hypothetical protein